VRPALPSASATTAPGVPCPLRRALRPTSRASAGPTGQTEASAPQPLPSAATTRCRPHAAHCRANRERAAGLAAGGRPPAAAGELSLPKRFGSVVYQLGCRGRRIRSRRGRQVTCREAVGAGGHEFYPTPHLKTIPIALSRRKNEDMWRVLLKEKASNLPKSESNQPH
jgi:hypothetical protein